MGHMIRNWENSLLVEDAAVHFKEAPIVVAETLHPPHIFSFTILHRVRTPSLRLTAAVYEVLHAMSLGVVKNLSTGYAGLHTSQLAIQERSRTTHLSTSHAGLQLGCFLDHNHWLLRTSPRRRPRTPAPTTHFAVSLSE